MTPELIVAVIVAVFTGGAGTAVWTMKSQNVKLRAESGRVIIEGAEDVVIIQRGLIEDLRTQMGALTDRVKYCEELTAAAEARAGVAEAAAVALVHERDQLLTANAEMLAVNTDLEERVAHLEAEVRRLGGTLP